MELLLPSSCLTWALHYFTHMASTLQFCGPASTWSMYAWERTGALISKASQACQSVETGMVMVYRMRELCSYLRIEDPSIYDSLPLDGMASAAGANLDPDGRGETESELCCWTKEVGGQHVKLTPFDLLRLSTFYDQTPSIMRGMREGLHRVGSLMSVRDIKYDDMIKSLRQIRARRRVFRVMSAVKHVKPWEGGLCTVEYKDGSGLDGRSYGVLIRILSHKPFVHPESPRTIVFEVQPWDSDFGTTSLKRARKSQSQPVLVHYEKVCLSTLFFKPIIPGDIVPNQRYGYTHNIVFVGKF